MNKEVVNKYAPISVLMSTYSGDKLEYLKESIFSIINQTWKPMEFIITIDGEIPEENYFFLDSVSASQPMICLVNVKKVGLAGALNAGLKKATQPFIARMDSDDISIAQRFQIQLPYLIQNKWDLICSWHKEFDDNHPEFSQIKKCPHNHDDIEKSLIWRCVISHPTIIVKREKVLQVNGYSEDMVPLEDYDLYYKLLNKNSVFGCYQDSLVLVRVSGQAIRRGNFRNVSVDLRLKKRALERGNITHLQFFIGFTALSVFRLFPVCIKKIIYLFLRSR